MDKSKFENMLIPLSADIKQAMNSLNSSGEKIVFAVDEDKKIVGTVTDGDIRRGITKGKSLTTNVGDIMNTGFVSINSSESELEEKAVRLMKEHVIEYVPVVDEKGLLVDVIFIIDLLSPGTVSAPTERLDTQVVIMAGGKGSRLDPFTKILPKPLIPVGNKPIVENIMDRLFQNGFDNFSMILNYKKEMIKIYFSENKHKYNLEFIEEDEYQGTAGGLEILKSSIKETFLVTNCDTILEGDYKEFLKWHRRKGNIMTIIGSHREITVPYGVLTMKDETLLKIDEKPSIDIFINTGTYVMEPAVLDYISKGEKIDMDKLIERIKADNKESVGVFPHWGGWFDMGQWDEYRKTLKNIEGGLEEGSW